ncbi:hypothetical protein NT05LI_2485 [Listeria ivanovii FSL F6-596]|nr:hypothetical protein NT05LI_2485 [Listeria ivanovii FSL F6-596]
MGLFLSITRAKGIALLRNGQIKGKWIIHSSFSRGIAISFSPYYT